MKVSDLTGSALDWAVMKCDGICKDFPAYWVDEYPSTNWAQGGPIIERERIRLDPRGVWVAGHDSSNDEYSGPTPLIAAMRCYVASRFGDEIEVPDELLQGEEA
jgi:hypothetical protein